MRQQREVSRQANEENDKRKIFNHFWIRFHGVYVAAKAVYNIFNEKRIEKDLKIKMLYTCKQIKRNLKKRVARFGPDYDSRTQNLN